jgi:hypothetical protein
MLDTSALVATRLLSTGNFPELTMVLHGQLRPDSARQADTFFRTAWNSGRTFHRPAQCDLTPSCHTTYAVPAPKILTILFYFQWVNMIP